MALLTSTIGSFPKPPALHEARRRFREGEIDAAALREVEDEAVRRAVAFQERLGLSLLVDGEMDRADPITTFAESLSGIEIDGWVRVYGDRYVRRPKIVGEVGRGVAATTDRWVWARDLTRGVMKAVIPGPYSLMDAAFDEHYGSRREACLAFAGIVRDEALALVAAGAREIQLDEPSAGARPAEIDLLHQALEHVVAPLRARARVWLYLGYVDFGSAGEALATLPAHGLLVAGAHCDYDGVEAFTRALPADRVAGIGIVDVVDPRIETEDEIRRRIAHLRELLPADRLWAVPDGGLRALRIDVARAKLTALAAAAMR
jgi:5-methyltetrahydropteroyltriglutamate--homocysteine methyltransferase